MILSTPVCGVDTKKEITAPLLAPSFFNSTAVGTTPQEHSGKGTPTIDAFTTEENFSDPRCLRTFSFLM